MKNFNYKIMNETQIAEINELWKDHGEAITAYGLECVNADKSGHAIGAVVGAGIGLLAGLGYLGVKGYRKYKIKQEEKRSKATEHQFLMV